MNKVSTFFPFRSRFLECIFRRFHVCDRKNPHSKRKQYANTNLASITFFCPRFYVNRYVSFDCVVHHMLPPILKEKQIKRSNKIVYQLQKKIEYG